MYADSLNRLRAALGALPTSLPSGSSRYSFKGWVPDPDALDTYGAECCVLNAHLEVVFGLRASAPICFYERGPGIESIVDVFVHYLTGDFTKKTLLEKWVTDLTEAAENIAKTEDQRPKRPLKTSAAMKRSIQYNDLVNEAAAGRKRSKQEKAAEIEEKLKLIAQTEQRCNWKHGFKDLEDDEPEAKLYTTGRRAIAIVDELVITCHSKTTKEQRKVDLTLRERAAEQLAKMGPANKAADLDTRPATSSASKASSANSTQPSVLSVAQSEGRKAKQARFDLKVINFVCATQIPPRIVDYPEFHSMISEANTQLKPKSASYLAYGQIPMESARIRTETVKMLRGQKNLTISFDGGTAISPRSFTTIHVTTADPREAYLMEGVDASGASHMGKYYFEELDKVIKEIGIHNFSGITCDSTGNTQLGRRLISERYPTIIILPDPCHQFHNAVKDICRLEYFAECISQIHIIGRFFSKSTKAATHLIVVLGRMGIAMWLKKEGKTRFAGIYLACISTRLCLPGIEKVIESGIVEVKKDHKLSFIKNIAAYSIFKTKLYQLEKLTEPFARAIKCLESGESNPSDVFIFSLAIMATLRRLIDHNETELSLPADVISKAQTVASARYYNMVLASGREVYIATFFLHPAYRNTHILYRNNLNPLSSAIVLRPQATQSSALDSDLRQSIPCYEKNGLFFKIVLCEELKAGTIPAAKAYSDSQSIVDAFKGQLATYTRGEYPFTAPPTSSLKTFHPLEYWKKLTKHPDACFLAPVAVKLFSLVPNSMAEERTVSCFTKLNSKYRASQKISTLVHMTRIRQHLIRERQHSASGKPRSNPVLKFQDLSSTLLNPQSANKSITPNTPEALTDNAESPGQPITTEPEEEASDDEAEHDDEPPEPVLDGAENFDPEQSYCANLYSPLLLDLL
ncbi:hypothetical protein FRC07_008337, partial [Ceratobasidium sp. 392]